MPMTRPTWLSAVFACSLLVGCFKLDDEETSVPDAGPLPPGVDVGGPCENHSQCRAGLSCDLVTKTCVPNGTVIQGGTCILSAECMPGNYCNQQGECAASGTQVAGGECSSEGDCVSGLMCAQAGLTGVCQAPGIAVLLDW